LTDLHPAVRSFPHFKAWTGIRINAEKPLPEKPIPAVKKPEISPVKIVPLAK
jgi:hypothetical protein